MSPSILHFSTSDTLGGSARSAYRIHAGLRTKGVNSRMLVGFRSGDDPDVRSVANSRMLTLVDRLTNKLSSALGQQYRFIPSNLGLQKDPWVEEADLVQLFNTHGGYLSLSALSVLGKGRPLVWRLSDLWPMTGHCAYPGDCEAWLDGCGHCPDLGAYPPIGIDRSASLFETKRRIYQQLNITLVAPSSWTEWQARRSPLLSEFPVVRIHNGLDDKPFRGVNRSQARQELGLPAQAKLILFCSHILDNNPRKGGDVLIKALQSLGNRPEWELMLMGEGGSTWLNQVPLPVHCLGFQESPKLMAMAYAAADTVVIPSVLENLPNTLIESLASGRAVVASDAGGMKDGVLHRRSGFLFPVGDYQQLAKDLNEVLENAALRKAMEVEAYRLFKAEFSQEQEIDRFVNLYSQLSSIRNI